MSDFEKAHIIVEMNVSESNYSQTSKNMESKKALIDFANYKTNYSNKPTGITSNNTTIDGIFHKKNQTDGLSAIFQIHWNKDIAYIVFQKFEPHDINEIPQELSSNKVLFEFTNKKLEFTFSGNHYILE